MKKVKKEKSIFNPKMNENVMIKDRSLIHYFGSIPTILFYEIITKSFMGIVAYGLKWLISFLMENSGVNALTNMDIPFLFRSWQGILVIILVILILFVYMVFDINCMVLICDNILHNKKRRIFSIMIESIQSVKFMLHPKAILAIVYISILAPLTLSVFGISLTESFYIPSFIMQVVEANTIYIIPYYITVIALAVLGFIYLFSFHVMILRKENISVAMHTSRMMMKKYWWNFIKRYGLFLLKTSLMFFSVFVLLVIMPLTAYYMIFNGFHDRVFLVFIALHSVVILYLLKAIFVPFQFMELNRIYESYTLEDEGGYIYPAHSLHLKFWALSILVYAGIFGISIFANDTELFDFVFPLRTASDVIAHRAGGTLANENTMWGLEASIERNVYGAEIDIQRTKDDHYIVYHDDDLSRLCGVEKTPDELTLAELKKLKVKDTFNSTFKTTELATIEEMLDGSKGRIHLFVELKGATANRQMADDLYDMIIERDMLDDVTVISLKYDLIEYLETEHPEVDTGYLCFISLGKVSRLKCDKLLLEDEMATIDVIDEAHEANKKVFIWTINSMDAMKKRMLDESDGIITDEVKMADDIYDQLSKRDDFSRVLDFLLLE